MKPNADYVAMCCGEKIVTVFGLIGASYVVSAFCAIVERCRKLGANPLERLRNIVPSVIEKIILAIPCKIGCLK